jgi:hypothetical protein
VLSKAFFCRNWPQYELDALAEREMAGNDKVLLPIWHGITHKDVMGYSLALSGRKAVSSSLGINKIVKEILAVIKPQGSPLIAARDYLLEWGVTPPVITDQYWLDVVEASNRVPGFGAVVPEESSWRRWSFPLPDKKADCSAWGQRLAWTAMQLNWVKEAEMVPITPLTPAKEVLQFIYSHPGLYETCMTFPDLLAEYAPQLTIPGFGGELEPRIEEEFIKSPKDEEWALRRKDFKKRPEQTANSYFHGSLFGPEVSPYDDVDHLIWLLSSNSRWLPDVFHSVLLHGMKKNRVWMSRWSSDGPFLNALFSENKKEFKWSAAIECDVRARIKKTIRSLKLEDTEDHLFKRFHDEKIPQAFLNVNRKTARERTAVNRP